MKEQNEYGSFLLELANEQEEKVKRYERMNRYAKKGQIVFTGSSLMEMFPINELAQGLGISYNIYNRGIGGFVIDQLLNTLEPCIFALEPKYLFTNIGTNNMNEPDYRLEVLLRKYEELLVQVRRQLPEVQIFLMAYYPVNPGISTMPYLKEVFRYRTNAAICEANEGLRRLAQKQGCSYLDLNAGITDEKGNLRKEYTAEGLHMYVDGYVEVLKAMIPILKSLQ